MDSRIMQPKRWKAEALKSLKPGAAWFLDDNDVLHWNESNTADPPTQSEWDAEATRLEEENVVAQQTYLAEYDAKEYARKRQKEYPVTKEFIEAYTEKEIGEDSTKWDAYVVKYNKVRSDNQKP
tara:strand:+ start:339 stop:710 length:372 start_codon:yes stop_codon:yes gene_type:complete